MSNKQKLVLYSGGNSDNNAIMHAHLADLVGLKNKKSFTYIPYCKEGAVYFYMQAQMRYRRYGFHRFQMLPIDLPITPVEIERAFTHDVIYLAGGNTFYFLKYLKKNGLLPHLKAFSRRGGVIAGLSAGAIILTPEITLAGYPSFDSDDNQVKLRDFKSLGLVDFEFFPHLSQGKRINQALLRYSRRGRLIVGASDGGGVVIDGNETKFLGKVKLFHHGHCDAVF